MRNVSAALCVATILLWGRQLLIYTGEWLTWAWNATKDRFMSSCYDARLTTCCCSGVVLGDGIRTLHKERLRETDLVHTQRGTSQAAVVNLHSCCLVAVRWRGVAICSRAENYVKHMLHTSYAHRVHTQWTRRRTSVDDIGSTCKLTERSNRREKKSTACQRTTPTSQV